LRSNASDVDVNVGVVVGTDKVVRPSVVFDVVVVVGIDGQVAFTSEKNMSEKHTSLRAVTEFSKALLSSQDVFYCTSSIDHS